MHRGREGDSGDKWGPKLVEPKRNRQVRKGFQQPCLLLFVGQGAGAVGVPVGFGDGAGVGYDRLYFPFGILTATTSTTLVWTCEVRSGLP